MCREIMAFIEEYATVGNTPTCVGNTAYHLAIGADGVEHPHMCGENWNPYPMT